MATLKHIASKNADYGRALEYLIFEHDESGNPIRDEEGNMLMRERFILDGINCVPFSYDLECRILNSQYHKNWKSSEIKSHHYIVSFDPADCRKGKLTPEHAQELGMELAAKCFPGHQILVCTHEDGHNKSGNIHVHICFNSLRKLDVDLLPFMDREIDGKAGYKHHLTEEYLQFLQAEVMQMCEREGLHQVDLLTPSKTHIRDGEYRAGQHGQEKLDELNERIRAAQMKPTQTVFQTQKQFLRESVKSAAERASSLEEFKKLMQDDYGIAVKDRRGRFSYLHPERQKYITDRALGSDFEKEKILEIIRMNMRAAAHGMPAEGTALGEETSPARTATAASQADEKQPAYEDSHPMDSYASPPTSASESASSSEPDKQFHDDRPLVDYDPSYDYHADPVAILYVRSSLRLVVDLQTNIKAQQSQAYANKVKLSNLKEMARTVVFIQEYGYDTYEELVRDQSYYSGKIQAIENSAKITKEKLKGVNEQIHFAGQYYSTRALHSDFLKAWNKKRFRSEHLEELQKYDESVRYFKENAGGTIPSMKELKHQKEELSILKEKQLQDLQSLRHYEKTLKTAVSNVNAILGMDTAQEKKRHTRGIEL